MQPKLIEWIDVGDVSSERDENLQHYFFDAGVSRTIIENPHQFLLLGRKGAGKTAVFRHLETRPNSLFTDNDLVVPLSLTNYSWKAHGLLADKAKGPGAQHRDSWRFVIAVESARTLFQSCIDKKVQPPNELEKAHKILEKLFSKPVPSWTDLLGEKLFRLSKFSLPSIGVNLSAEELTLDSGEISFEGLQTRPDLVGVLNRNLEALTNYLESAISNTIGEKKIFLIFDRLDEAWVTDYVGQSKEIIAGLLNASEYSLKKFNAQVRPIVFLREDIFSTLEINDKNKLAEDCSSTLKWNEGSLEQLVLKRVNYYASQAGASSINSLQDLFDRKEMRSRTSPVKHIFNRTMCRPRDIVAFLKRAIEDSQASYQELPTIDGLIKADSIYSAEPGYSDYLFGELSDEWRNQMPQFPDYLAILENLRYAVISSDELGKALEIKFATTDRNIVRSAIRFLFENSIVGFKVGDSPIWRYKCFYPVQGFTDSSIYKVHPGLIKHLGLTEGTSNESQALNSPE